MATKKRATKKKVDGYERTDLLHGLHIGVDYVVNSTIVHRYADLNIATLYGNNINISGYLETKETKQHFLRQLENIVAHIEDLMEQVVKHESV